jgi:GNAT superfamily N-acetyltransferase
MKLKKYDHETDFLRVRDFLNQTYNKFPAPYNWGLERWNYARYFVSPMLGAFGLNSQDHSASLAAIKLFNELVGLWENDDGGIAGVANIEHADRRHRGFGEIFLQRHPEHTELLEEMLIYGEEKFYNPDRGRVYIFVYETDNELINLLQKRNYNIKEEAKINNLELEIGNIPDIELPEGFSLHNMTESDVLAAKCEIFGRSFNHEDPADWPSVFSYEELQKAPDYFKANDFFITAPDGRYAATGLVWYDALNRIGHMEPLGTHPDFRGKKLASAITYAGLKKLKELGATKIPMNGGFDPFYQALGFKLKQTAYAWIKEF